MEKEERRERGIEITTWDILYENHLRRHIRIKIEISAFQGWDSPARTSTYEANHGIFPGSPHSTSMDRS